MPEIIVEEDCGNAPKKLVLRDFLIALAKGDSQHVADNITDNIHWNLVGTKVLVGREEVTAAFDELVDGETSKLVIDNIVTHGSICSANGTWYKADGRVVAFCDVYRFNSHAKHAKLKEITSYIIPLKT